MKQAAADFPTLTGAGAERLRRSEDRIVIAGAGGWIGLAALEQLRVLLGEAFERRVFSFGSSRRTLSLRGGLEVDQHPLDEMLRLPPAPTLVLHLAFLTQEKAGLMSREAYIQTNRAISDTVYRALGEIDARGVFVASSGAVELAGVAGAHPNKALYGALKLEDEARFAAWAHTQGRRCVISRIFGLSGPYINKLDSYALACFVVDALAGRPIAVSSSHPVYRSYVAVDELMSVVFGLLTDGETGTTLFDTGAERGYEMQEIAEAVDAALGGAMGVRRPPVTGTQPDRYVGDGVLYRRLCAQLGVRPIAFAEQVRETARYLAETPALRPTGPLN